MSAGADGATPLEVVVGLLRDPAGRVLVGCRPEGAPLAGWWEFPGGKRRSEETPREALGRELREELGIRVVEAARLLDYCYAYPERRVHLDVWSVESYEGEPRSLEAQQLKWLPPGDLAHLKLLEADWPIVDRLRAGPGG